MIPENIDRNFLIYELWEKGCTIDEISFDTGIPRSTVGYYIRKFNKRAKSGEPIAFLHEREKPDEKDIALIAFIKHGIVQRLDDWSKEGTDGMDKIYKFLMILKLFKELQRDLFPIKEQEKALAKHSFYIIKQLIDAVDMLPRTET